MRRFIISFSLLLLLLCTACDSLRKLAGRPTSADIERKRQEIALVREQEHQKMMDSLAVLEKALKDSLNRVDSLEKTKLSRGTQARGTLLNPARMGGLFATKLDYRYYVVVGAFSQRANAEKMIGIVNKAGYVGVLICFKNGLNAVGVCQTDNLNSAYDSLDKVKGEKFCPADAWILVNE